MVGNLIQISVTIHHIKMRCQNDLLYTANFQIGSLQSNQTVKAKLIDNIIDINQTIKLSCQKSSLIAQKNKVVINVFSHSNINRRINNQTTVVGNLTLLCNNKINQQQEIVKKLQNCRIRNAQMMLSWKICSKQLNIIQHHINSPTSQSSFSSLKQLHYFLTEKDNPQKVKLQKIRSFRRSVQKQDVKNSSCQKQNGSLKSPKMSQISPILQQNNNMTFNDFDWSFLKNADAHYENIVQLQQQNQRLKKELQQEKELNSEKQVKFQENVRNFVATMSDLEKKIIQFQRKLLIKDQTIKALENMIQEQKIESSGQKKTLLTRKQLGQENKKRFSRKSSNQNSLRSSRISRQSSTKGSKIFSRVKDHETQSQIDIKKQKISTYHFNIEQQLKMLESNQLHAVPSSRFFKNDKKDKFAELQNLNEQLYYEIRNLKASIKSYEQKLKSKEINQQILKTENQELKSDLNKLKKQQMNQKSTGKVKANQELQKDIQFYIETIEQIQQENYQLKMKNKEYEKKLGQSLLTLQKCRKQISMQNQKQKFKLNQFSFDRNFVDEESDSGIKSGRTAKVQFQKTLLTILEKTINDRQKIVSNLKAKKSQAQNINYHKILNKLKARIQGYFLQLIHKQQKPLESNIQIIRIIQEQFQFFTEIE